MTLPRLSNGKRTPADVRLREAVAICDTRPPRLIFSTRIINLRAEPTFFSSTIGSKAVPVLVRLICDNLLSILPASEPLPTTVRT